MRDIKNKKNFNLITGQQKYNPANCVMPDFIPGYSVVHCQFFGVTKGLIENNLTEKEADELLKKLNKDADCYEWYEKKPNV